jgi:hypothetical protein
MILSSLQLPASFRLLWRGSRLVDLDLRAIDLELMLVRLYAPPRWPLQACVGSLAVFNSAHTSKVMKGEEQKTFEAHHSLNKRKVRRKKV